MVGNLSPTHLVPLTVPSQRNSPPYLVAFKADSVPFLTT